MAAALIGSSLIGNDSLLSPEEAVAAVAADMRGDGILHWSATGAQTNRPSSPLGKRDRLTFDEWIDLRSGASHVVSGFTGATKGIDDEPPRVEQWWDGRRTSFGTAPPSMTTDRTRQTVTKTVYPDSARLRQRNTPVDDATRRLARAAAGQAKLSDGGVWRGAPVTKVTERETSPTLTWTTTTWIVRTKKPRLLKTNTETVDARGRFVSSYTLTTDTWQIYGADDATARAHVAPPKFDPALYDVKVSPLNGGPAGGG